jgi:hypothetical protein
MDHELPSQCSTIALAEPLFDVGTTPPTAQQFQLLVHVVPSVTSLGPSDELALLTMFHPDGVADWAAGTPIPSTRAPATSSTATRGSAR